MDSTIATSPLTYGAAQHVLNRFANGYKTSAELLAQAINAFAANARIPKQLIMTIPAHWMLADSGATIHLLFDLLLTFADVETHRIVRDFNGSESQLRHVTGPFPVSPVPALAGEVAHRYRL